jgi:hypothetical protein
LNSNRNRNSIASELGLGALDLLDGDRGRFHFSLRIMTLFLDCMDNRSAEALLIGGEDYYVENGLMVLTARYLLRRGYCCEQGCRHCPYTGNRKDVEMDTSEKQSPMDFSGDA